MESRFDLSQASAELAEEVRGEKSIDLDAMVSKLIPYGLYRKAQVDVANIFFEDARRDFMIAEAEEGLGRALTDREVREIIIAAIGMSLGQEAEIDVCYASELSAAACVRLMSDDWEESCEDLVSGVCRDVEQLPLVDIYACYEGDDGDFYDEIPEEAEPEDFRELTAADIFCCEGAEPDYIEEILEVMSVPEHHSYDYLVPELMLSDDEDGEMEMAEEEELL